MPARARNHVGRRFGPLAGRGASLLVLAAVFLAAPRAPAQEGGAGREAAGPATPEGAVSFESDVSLEAAEATFERVPGGERIELRGGVVVRAEAFRLEADDLAIVRRRGALEASGEARLAFCPCPDPPLAFGASGARYEGGDLWLENPRLLALGFPVLGLPLVWLRAPGRAGLLPPRLERRSDAGWLVGGGLFAPLGPRASVEASAGAFTEGGAEASATLLAPAARLGVLHATGDAGRTRLEGTAHADLDRGPGGSRDPDRGASSIERAIALRIDLLRGERARAATPELEVAAMPYDVAAVEASLRGPGERARPLVALGALARGVRAPPSALPASLREGEGSLEGAQGALALGPSALLDLQGTLGRGVSYAAWTSGVLFARPGNAGPERGASAFGEAGVSVEGATFLGPFLASAETRERLRALVLEGGEPSRASPAGREAVASARLSLSIPMARAFSVPGDAREGASPLVHAVEPAIEGRAFAVHARGLRGEGGQDVPLAPGLGALPASGFALGGGASTSLGRYAGPAAALSLRAGAVSASADARAPAPAAFARAGLSSGPASLALEAFGVAGAPLAPLAPRGAALALSGKASHRRASLGAGLVLQRGAPGAARLLDPGPGSPLPGDDVDPLVASATSAMIATRVPLGGTLGAGARVDLDLDADPAAKAATGAAPRAPFAPARLGRAALVAARAGIDLTHACGCFALGVEGKRRVGRGLDVLVKLELVPSRR